MITIIDYGMGNLGSIHNMLKKIGVDSIITSNISKINNANKIILPGVGSFDRAMQNLNSLKLIDILNEKVVNQKTPILGICLGMQLFAKISDEGVSSGLGWINANVRKFDLNRNLKVPHMGWNIVEQKKNHIIFEDMDKEPRFYFVHNYFFDCLNNEDVLATTYYGGHFVSVVCKKNILGVQFHPEKSHKFGMKLLENYSKL